MIHYQLLCADRHEFDGWFQDSAGFEKLARAGLVECPNCGSTNVTRALMSPSIGRRRDALPANPVATRKPDLPAEMMAMLQRVRSAVEKDCDYVGEDFATEARLMQAGKSARRGIYGETNSAEAEALREEGVDVVRIPWVPRADG